MASIGGTKSHQQCLANDPRTHPKLLRGLAAHDMQHHAFLSSDIAPEAPLPDVVAFCRGTESALESMIHDLDFEVNYLHQLRPIQRSEYLTDGGNGDKVKLILHRPVGKGCKDPPTAIVYFHGGGMVMLRTENRLHTTYAEAMAKMGFVAILVDFRNVLPTNTDNTVLRCFPAGSNDCVSAVQWIHTHRDDLHIGKIVLHGDSGGGNLALSTAMRLNKEEQTRNIVDGVFAIDPYISGAYDQPHDWKLAHLPSLVKLDGYDVSCSGSSIYSRLYDQQGTHRRNPLAWPYWASEEDLHGLPPHLIVTAELDPLKDEGNEYCRKLRRSGVNAAGQVRLGMSHTGDLLLRSHVPDEFSELLFMLRGFVDRLGGIMVHV